MTSHDELLDHAVRIGAAAGVELSLADSAAAASAAWSTSPLVLIGADLASSLIDRGVPRRPGVVMLSLGDAAADLEIWRHAVSLGAEHVAVLPEAERWLIDRLAEAGDGPHSPGPVVTVLPGRGGAGASTLAVMLARTMAPSTLVDLDPLGGGLDARLEMEVAPGLRWPDLAVVRGRLSSTALRGSLPRLGDVAVLSASTPVALPIESVASVIDACSRSGVPTVLDGTRDVSAAARMTWSRSDLSLIVVPTDLGALCSSRALAETLVTAGCRVAAVIRRSRESSIDAMDVEKILGVPIAGEWRHDRSLARGESPLGVPTRSVRSIVSAIHDLIPHPRRYAS